MCGKLVVKRLKSTAFRGDASLKVEAWDVGTDVDIRDEYVEGAEVTKTGCFLAIPKPYYELNTGRFCVNSYQAGMQSGEEGVQQKMCWSSCKQFQGKKLTQYTTEDDRDLFDNGLTRGYQRSLSTELKQECRDSTTQMQRQRQY